MIRDGKAKDVVDELEPQAERHEKVREFVNRCKGNLHRMKYDHYRSLDMPQGSGAIESSCKHIVAGRLKRSCSRWSMPGATGIMAIRCCLENNRVADLFEWRAAA